MTEKVTILHSGDIYGDFYLKEGSAGNNGVITRLHSILARQYFTVRQPSAAGFSK